MKGVIPSRNIKQKATRTPPPQTVLIHQIELLQTNAQMNYEYYSFGIVHPLQMPRFATFTHEKSLISPITHGEHFQRLKKLHTPNAFLLVGAGSNSFSGALGIEFQPMEYVLSKSRKQEGVINCEQSQPRKADNKTKMEDEATEQAKFQVAEPVEMMDIEGPDVPGEQSNKTILATSGFERNITSQPSSAFLKKEAESAIEIVDSESEVDFDELYEDMPELPQFNNDHKYYTPTFVLPRPINAHLDTEWKQQFTKKLQQSRKEIKVTDIMLPRPRSKHMYCGVCKQHYEEYLGHVKGKNHQEMTRKIPFAQHIRTLQIMMNVGETKRDREKELKRLKAKEEKDKKKELEQILKKKQEQRKKIEEQLKKKAREQREQRKKDKQAVKREKSSSQSDEGSVQKKSKNKHKKQNSKRPPSSESETEVIPEKIEKKSRSRSKKPKSKRKESEFKSTPDKIADIEQTYHLYWSNYQYLHMKLSIIREE